MDALMPIRIRCRNKPLDTAQPMEDKTYSRAPGNLLSGVLCGQESQVPHVMRINVIIVMCKRRD